MRKAFLFVCAFCIAILLLTGTSLAAVNGSDQAVTNFSNSAELLPVSVVYSSDRFEIRKVYELSPDVDPSRLPRDSFAQSGYAYNCTDILREVVIGEETKTVTMIETVESKKDDTTSVFAVLPQYKVYVDDDDFTGYLLIDTATIKSEISGYGSYSTPYTVSRNYPNLSDCDTQYIPKTVDDNGKTLQLQDINWQTDNTYNIDDYEIGTRYTAIAAYGGTRTSSYVTGYDITASYSGEVSRRGVALIRYTVIFTGVEIPAPAAPPEPSIPVPEPEEPIATIPEPVKDSADINWLPLLISALALLVSGVCLFLILKKRKDNTHYERAPQNDYSDIDTGDFNDAAGFGGGNI